MYFFSFSLYAVDMFVSTGTVISTILHSFCMYVCMYLCGQIAQVVEHQTADPWIVGSSLTSGEKCKNC